MVNQRRVATAAGGATPATGALTQARAAEMATYTQQLLAPSVRRIEEQAEELGTRKERLATAERRITERETPPAAEETAPHEGAAPEVGRRPWWQRLVWGELR